ncbi:MAG: hypothetical protein BGP12_09795 [Rhodospirillales bacterium 70-18]|nr:MAG: hypothetical protein BGP12_09795 [Rhodospirillales bacterium 70-18]
MRRKPQINNDLWPDLKKSPKESGSVQPICNDDKQLMRLFKFQRELLRAICDRDCLFDIRPLRADERNNIGSTERHWNLSHVLRSA